MKLNTFEKFLLIAHHPSKGRFAISEVHINYGIIGAGLMEMSLFELIKIEKQMLVIKNGIATNNAIVSEISMIIKNSKKPRKIKYWIPKLARKSKKYKWIVLNDLANKRLIRIEHKKFLGLIPYRKTYLTGSRLRNNLISQLKKNILHRQDLSDEDIVILGLIEACEMHKILSSDKEELKRLKKELKEIIKESSIANTLDETIKQVQAAIIGAMVASMVAVTAATAGSH